MGNRAVGNLIGAAILCGAVFLFGTWVKDRSRVFADYAVENEAFAETYFVGLFPYDAVLATQRWHPRGAQAWDCTFAVVSIQHDLPLEPVTRDSSVMGWQFAWGGDWQATPAPRLGDSTRDAISFCAQRLPDGLGQRLQTALDGPGSLFTRDSVGETVMIYAPAHGLAARIRYGD